MSAQLPSSLPSSRIPLVIDLDGTLIRTDLLHESVIKLVRGRPHLAFALPAWLMVGKANLKRQIADRVSLEVQNLPYDDKLLEWIRAEKASGRSVILCTASEARYAQSVADHLGLFDDVIATNGVDNVTAERKAQLLVSRYGERGFDYAGNSSADLVVWARARSAIVVDAPQAVRDEARRSAEVEREFERPAADLHTWLRAMRLHQWLKNLLVLLPVAGAFQLGNLFLVQQALFAFLAFGLCASSVYVLNDIMDLESDRAHPRKKLRPFASGQLSLPKGLVFALALLALSALIAGMGRPAFMFWLGVYFALTLAYTFFLKRRVLADCITLGILYTIRIVAGAAAVALSASFWLISFSLFLFLSLAFVKRYSELVEVAEIGGAEAHGRGYRAADLPLVLVMGVAAGFSSVLLLALYINGDTVQRLYSQPEVLWLTIPIQLYWISRMWIKAQRGNMHDDPIVFALRDPYSLACGALFAATLVAAR